MTNQPHSLKDDELVELGFLSANPCLGRFPHVFVRSCRNTLKILAATIDPAPGLWGEYPLFRSDGSHYFLPQNGKITTDFALWKLNANQRYLLERATVGPDPQFKMFISADTPVSVLERTYEHFRESLEDATWFGDYIEYVCDWILGLRWALIPLEGEIGWSIFVVAQDAEPLVEKLKREFQRNQIPVAHLEAKGQRFHWVNDSLSP